MSKDKSETIYKSRKALIVDNFLAGIAWGLGTVMGATIIVAVIGIMIAQTQQLPVIGQFINSISTQPNSEIDNQ